MFRSVLFLGLLWVPGYRSVAQQTDSLKSDSLHVKRLDEINVTNKYYRKYQFGSISSGLRLQTSLLEAPQNIQVVHADVMHDQLAYQLNESVTRNVSGTMREELHNGISPDIYSRGGYINAQRNGVDLRPIIKGPLGDDAAIIEAIEFVKGPSGFMTAMSDPAGSYNIITKKPTGARRNTLRMMAGSFGLLRAEADLQGVVDEREKWWVRVNLMGMHRKGFMKFDNNERVLIAPAVTYKASGRTAITLELIYQRLNYMMLSEAQISPYGYGTLPVDFTISDPNIRPYRANDYNAFMTWEQSLSDRWKLTSRASYVNNDYNGSIMWVYGVNEPDPDILNRYYVYDAIAYTVFSGQSYVQGNYRTGEVSHRFLGGIDFNYKDNRSTDTWETASTVYPLSIANPTYANVINNNGTGGDFGSENGIDSELNRTHGWLYYTSLHAMNESLLFGGKLTVGVGGRLTFSEADFKRYGEPVGANDAVFTPRVSLSYLPGRGLNVYALYDNTFLPQVGMAQGGVPLKPLTGSSVELGAKKDWQEGAWNTSLAVYRIRRNRMLVNDPATGEVYQTGESLSQGVEVDVKGRLAPGLDIIVNYAYTDSEISRDDLNPDRVGKATPNRIRHLQNTWLNYTLSNSVLSGLSFSAGYQYWVGRAERFTTVASETMDNFFRVDAGIGYRAMRLGIQLMVNNVLNRHNYSTAWQRNGLYYWVQQPLRHFRCGVTFDF